MDITVYKDCDKIYTLDNFMIVRARLTGEGKTLVFTNGCYDLIHPGHIRLLQKARLLIKSAQPLLISSKALMQYFTSSRVLKIPKLKRTVPCFNVPIV